jgi:hypothetical protein
LNSDFAMSFRDVFPKAEAGIFCETTLAVTSAGFPQLIADRGNVLTRQAESPMMPRPRELRQARRQKLPEFT